jgi:DNA-binding transcriptional LysR family regulator
MPLCYTRRGARRTARHRDPGGRPLVASLPEGHPLGNPPEIALEALGNEPWIFFPRAVASRLHDEIIHACHEAGFTPRIVQETLKLSTISSLVASGARRGRPSGHARRS